MKFPENPEDGTIFEPRPSVFYVYEKTQNQWTRLGNFGSQVKTATPLSDGLMPSEDFVKLNGLMLPPPQTIMTADGCDVKFDEGQFGFRSSNEDLIIEHELSLFTVDGEQRADWHVHGDTHGINFRVDLDKLIAELEERGNLTHRKSMGPTGERGDRGDPGIDGLETGPPGDQGDEGTNLPYPGTLRIGTEDFRVDQDNRGVVDVRAEIEEGEGVLVVTRANLGDPDFCPKFLKPSRARSKWITVVDERPVHRQILKECGTESCAGPSCGATTTGTAQTFCATRLLYLDFEPIEKAVRARFDELLAELKDVKERVAKHWLETMVSVYDQQKRALCCATENCESRRENQRHRTRIEDIKIHAARDGLTVGIDQEFNDRKYVDANPDKECPQDQGDQVLSPGPGPDGGPAPEPTVVDLTVDCAANSPDLTEETAASMDLPPGRYEVSVSTCCCYSVRPITGLAWPDNAIQVSEQEWQKVEKDQSLVPTRLAEAWRRNEPYTSAATVRWNPTPDSELPKVAGARKFELEDGTLVAVSNLAARSGRTVQAVNDGLASDPSATFVIEHVGGAVLAVNPVAHGLQALERSRALKTGRPPSPAVGPTAGNEGSLTVSFKLLGPLEGTGTDVTAQEPSQCEAGFEESVTVDSEANSFGFTPVQFKEGDNQLRSPFGPFSDDEQRPVLVNLPAPGQYELEIGGGAFFDAFTVTNFRGGNLVVTEEMYAAAAAEDEDAWIAAWRGSRDSVQNLIDDDPFKFSVKLGQASGLINDFDTVEALVRSGQTPGWSPDVRRLRLLAAQRRPYNTVVTAVYSGFEDADDDKVGNVVMRTTVLDSRPEFKVDDQFVHRHDPKEGPKQDSERSGLFTRQQAVDSGIGLKVQLFTAGGQLALFFDDRDLYQADRPLQDQPTPNPNRGAVSVTVRCVPDVKQDCDRSQVEVVLDCLRNWNSPNAVQVALEPGEYVAEVIDCCCEVGSGSARSPKAFHGKFFVEYDNGKETALGTNAPLEVDGVLEDAFARYDRSTVAFRNAGTSIRTFVSPGERSRNSGGTVRIRIQTRECFETAPPDQGTGSGTTLTDLTGGTDATAVADFLCDLSAEQVRQYEFAWINGNCCGFLIEFAGTKWIVVKRSFGNDVSCGGGESETAPCMLEASQVPFHPAIAFPTFDGQKFLGKPSSGFRRMFRDVELENELVSRLRLGAFDLAKSRQGFTIAPGNVLRGPIEDRDLASDFATNFGFEFEGILFPVETS